MLAIHHSLTSASVGNPTVVQFPMYDHADEESDRPALTFSEEWKILGPFTIGTRGTRDLDQAIRSAMVDCGN
jgi:hypothetical protein